jgi:hypothetical protein
MPDLKHVARLKTSGRKVLVAYRTLPGDAYSCLVIDTASLSDDDHNSLIQLVESPAAQDSYEFAETLARAKFTDGSTMLPSLHVRGKLIKVPTDTVEMIPNFTTSIVLSELNQIIAEQRGVSVGDLALTDPNANKNVEVVEVGTVTDMMAEKKSSSATTTSESINQDTQPLVTNLSPEEQAKKFRSDADRLSKQAADLRRQAESLVPTKKKATTTS